MAVKKAAPAKMTPREAQIAGNERRLLQLAAKLRRAAAQIDLAATYAGDGATLTADAIARTGRARGGKSVSSIILEVQRNIESQRWSK